MTNWRQQEAARWLLTSMAGDAAVQGHWLKVDAEEEEKFGKGGNVHLFAYVGSNYCRPCADAVLGLMERFLGGDEDEPRAWLCMLDSESDHTEHCDICGQLLHYHLTDYGAEAEIEHFESRAPVPTVYPDDAYYLAQLVSARWDGDVQEIVHRALARPVGIR